MRALRKQDKAPSAVVQEAWLHVRCRRHSPASLARALGVSSATLGRVLAELRKYLACLGIQLLTVSDGAKTWYGLDDEEWRARCWKDSPLRRHAGSVRKWRAPRKGSQDDFLYGPAR
ncbi:MAG: hypothetical protein FD180_851 [Planctomycetota bacterium]|nr:MAG: hypothetical protein FD180_851 [Planctomycetota bacterium]